MLKKCTYCEEQREETSFIHDPTRIGKYAPRFCDETCLDLWTRIRKGKKQVLAPTRTISLDQPDRDYHGRYTT